MGTETPELSPNDGSIMIIAEERHTITTLFNDKGTISNKVLTALNLRGRFNPDLRYYKVTCEAYKRYGYTADELFNEIYEKYKASGYKPLNEILSYIERI